MNQIFAFTASYPDGIHNQLICDIVVRYTGKNVCVKGQWDTGAMGTCISHEVVSTLGLIPTGKRNVCTPTGIAEVNTFLIDVVLPNDITIENLVVCESDIGSQGLGMLVGMDIISLGDFAISKLDGNTIFSFRYPSGTPIDFVQAIPRS